MTEAAQGKPLPKPSRLPVSAPVLWTGLALGTAAAVAALMHGAMLPLFGTRGFLAGALNVAVFVAVFLIASVAGTELTVRHHRTIARHAIRHGKRGTSAAYRGARRHGARGAGFVAAQARSWAARTPGREAGTCPDCRAEPGRAHDPTCPAAQPPASSPPGRTVSGKPAAQSPNPTGGTSMTSNGTRQPAPRRTAANGTVPGGWGAVVAHTTDFQAESDGDLLNWMRGEATGAAAYAEAMVEQYETCLNVIGVDPVAIQTLHDVADAATIMASTMAAAVKKFAEHYELPTQFVADGGLLAHDGRWHKGDDG